MYNHYSNTDFSGDPTENAEVIADYLLTGYLNSVEDKRSDNDADDLQNFFNAAMPRAAMLAFACDFFARRDINQIIARPHISPRQTARSELNPDNTFKDDRNRFVRNTLDKHLDVDQEARAKDVQKDHPEIKEVVDVFNTMVDAYLEQLVLAMDNHPEASSETGKMVIAFTEDSFTLSEFDEFTRVVAPSLALSSDLKDLKRPLIGEDFTSGIRNHLMGDLSGFESASHGKHIKSSSVNKCPYQFADGGFMRMWNTFFEKQDDGSYSSQPMTGGFFNSVMGALYPDRYPQFSGAVMEHEGLNA